MGGNCVIRPWLCLFLLGGGGGGYNRRLFYSTHAQKDTASFVLGSSIVRTRILFSLPSKVYSALFSLRTIVAFPVLIGPRPTYMA